MRLFFVLFLVCSALAVTAPATTDAEIVVPLTAILPEAATEITPVRLVVAASPSPSPTPTATPTASPRATPIATPTPEVVQVKLATPTPKATPKPTPKPTPKAKPTPIPTPKAAPTASPQRSSTTYSREEVKDAIRSVWGDDDDEAIRVADCESGLNPRAASPSGHYGLWQMRMETWHSYGGSGDPRDASPAAQTAAAWRLYQQRGWSPWAGCAA